MAGKSLMRGRSSTDERCVTSDEHRGDAGRPARSTALRLTADEGFSMVEVVIAITLLAMLAVGFTVTTGSSLELTGAAKERQTATQVAVTAVEEARAVPYAGLALGSDAVFEGSSTPDRSVGGSGTTYEGEAGVEELVLSPGGLAHREQIDITGVPYELYRYVTWVPDGANPTATKRITVVVVHPGAAHNGTGDEVTLSSILSRESVAFTSTSSTSSTVPSSTTTSSTTSTTVNPGACSGDVTTPALSMSILAGTGANQGYTGSQNVNLALSASDPCTPLTMAFSNDGVSYSAGVPFSTSAVRTLEAGDGQKTVWTRVTDAAGNASVVMGTIKLDSTKPTTPASFVLAPSTGGTKKVTLTWSPATDNDTLVGYRVFKAVNSGTATSLASDVTSCGSTCSVVDNTVKNNTTYTYYVVSFDAAGNQSVQTPSRSHTF